MTNIALEYLPLLNIDFSIGHTLTSIKKDKLYGTYVSIGRGGVGGKLNGAKIYKCRKEHKIVPCMHVFNISFDKGVKWVRRYDADGSYKARAWCKKMVVRDYSNNKPVNSGWSVSLYNAMVYFKVPDDKIEIVDALTFNKILENIEKS